MRFRDRVDAGQQLAEALDDYKYEDVVVFALPRGGVVLGYYIAKHLGASLDLIVTGKVGHPYNPEHQICAVAEDGHAICNETELTYVNRQWLERQIERTLEETHKQRDVYIHNKKRPNVAGKTAILVDDGIASASNFLLAIHEIQHMSPKQIIATAPIASEEVAMKIRREVDDLVILNVPFDYMGAVGAYYDEYYPIDDDEVTSLMEQAP